MLLDGKVVAAALQEQMKKDVEALKGKGVNPTLGIIRLGEKTRRHFIRKRRNKKCRSCRCCGKKLHSTGRHHTG